uniref:Alkylglycerol monooxygenase n=1 Tax=Timema monikensis TaxID=170555 RepID=A0A7R9HRH3_9NEOP|nr:unnamed protein product [Timema monikensis]
MFTNETLSVSFGADSSRDILRGLAQMFYMVSPQETTFEEPEEVPKYFRQAWPYFLAFLIVENVLLWMEEKTLIRFNDGITSLSHGLFLECGRLVFRGAENVAYIFIYENFRLVELPWDSAWTWYLAVVGVDFCYYWLHRACHEVHILWAQHQVHHSSEEFNLTVGLRQSILQGWCGFGVREYTIANFGPVHVSVVLPATSSDHPPCTLPHAPAVQPPVPVLDPHQECPHLGSSRVGVQHPETPQGCNLYCLDKNYGGLLIIWDRLFGTFADERPKEEIIYGLVYNQPSFNPFFLQIFYNMNVINKWKSMSNWQDKLAAVWKGPSWIPGKPRLGADEDKLDIKSRDKYNVQLPLWCNLYLLIHFVVVVIGFQELALRYMGMSPLAVLGFVAYILTSLTTIGMLFDNHPYACLFELVRCLAFVWYVHVFGLNNDPAISILQRENKNENTECQGDPARMTSSCGRCAGAKTWVKRCPVLITCLSTPS